MKKINNYLVIQDRDIEIFRFCLEMKFADIESINKKVFSNDFEMFSTRKRVQKLEMAGFLKSVSLLPGTTKKFYVTTSKGYNEVKKNASTLDTPKPPAKISTITFEHDLGVLKSRLLLEKQGRAFDWRSERLIKVQAEVKTGRISRDFMPDAIFKSKHGKTCAFEFENKPKTEVQLKEKIYRLNALMESSDPVFEACLFVSSNDNLKKKIKNITDLVSNKFVVQSFKELEKIGS
jgi:hypothetical protein